MITAHDRDRGNSLVMQGGLGGFFLTDWIGDAAEWSWNTVKGIGGGLATAACDITGSTVGQIAATTGGTIAAGPSGAAVSNAGIAFTQSLCSGGSQGPVAPNPEAAPRPPQGVSVFEQMRSRYAPPKAPAPSRTTTALPKTPTTPTVPVGQTIAAFDPKIGKYRVAVRTSPAGFAGLGQPYKEVAASTTRPAGAEIVPLVVFEQNVKRPWYKRWQTYAVAGGVVAVGTAGYLVYRRR